MKMLEVSNSVNSVDPDWPANDELPHLDLNCLPSSFQILMDGWMTCVCTSFSIIFQSYQGDERLIMKGCAQWNPVHG